MKRNLIFILLAILLLTPWPVAYAYDNKLAGAEPMAAKVSVAEPSATPTMKAFGQAIGGINAPGDLFYVDNTENAADVSATLYLTNSDELIHYYRYLILNIGAYVQTGTDQWQKLIAGNGELVPEIYLTMQNGRASFTLPGYGNYKLAVDSGCFYYFGGAAEEGDASPKFYLDAE